MFYLYTAMRNIKRQKVKSLLNAGICLLIVLLLNLYLGSMESSRKQLRALPEAVPVYGRIMNLNGSREVGLNISDERITGLEASPFIKDLAYTIYLKAGIGDFMPVEWKEKLNFIVLGTNSIQSVSGLAPEHIQLKDGEGLEFLESSSPKCIVSREKMAANQWNIGDRVQLNFYYYRRPSVSELYLDPLKLMPVEIVGTMDMSSAVVTGDSDLPDILVPVGLARESHKERDIPFFADSAFFYLKNPLLLNEFKASLKKGEGFRLMEVIPTAEENISGNALALRDAVFIDSATSLQQGISILNGFLPVVSGAVVFIGYISAFLLVQSRRKELSIMRSAGMGRWGCFGVFFIEQGVLITGSWLLARIVFMLFISGGPGMVPGAEAALCLCYLLGVAAALWRIVKKSVMEALASAD